MLVAYHTQKDQDKLLSEWSVVLLSNIQTHKVVLYAQLLCDDVKKYQPQTSYC